LNQAEARMNRLAEPPMINVHEAKTHFSKLLERAHAGEEIILAKSGKPYARLVPLNARETPRRQPGKLKGWDIPDGFFDPLPEEELRVWDESHPTDPPNQR
jgi:prevent-host-death family protein